MKFVASDDPAGFLGRWAVDKGVDKAARKYVPRVAQWVTTGFGAAADFFMNPDTLNPEPETSPVTIDGHDFVAKGHTAARYWRVLDGDRDIGHIQGSEHVFTPLPGVDMRRIIRKRRESISERVDEPAFDVPELPSM